MIVKFGLGQGTRTPTDNHNNKTQSWTSSSIKTSKTLSKPFHGKQQSPVSSREELGIIDHDQNVTERSFLKKASGHAEDTMTSHDISELTLDNRCEVFFNTCFHIWERAATADVVRT